MSEWINFYRYYSESYVLIRPNLKTDDDTVPPTINRTFFIDIKKNSNYLFLNTQIVSSDIACEKNTQQVTKWSV